MTLYPKLITDALAQVRYPGNGKDLIEAGLLDDDPRIDGMKVSFSIVFDKNPDPFMKSLFKSIEATIHREISPDVEVTITPKYRLAERPEVGKLLPQVKNIIAAKVLFPQTWLSLWRLKATMLGCSMLTSLALPCLKCLVWKTNPFMRIWSKGDSSLSPRSNMV